MSAANSETRLKMTAPQCLDEQPADDHKCTFNCNSVALFN